MRPKSPFAVKSAEDVTASRAFFVKDVPARLHNVESIMIAAHFLIGVVYSLALFATAFFIGLFVMLGSARREKTIDFEASDMLIATCFGLAVIIFSLFWLGTAHLFFKAEILLTLIVLVTSSFGCAVGRVGFSRACSAIGGAVHAAVGPAWLIAFAICLAIAEPALLPATAFDSTMYHLPNAINWAATGSLVVDPYLRFPLAQFNIELLFAMTYALGLEAYTQFVPWMFVLISATGIVSLTSKLIVGLGASRLASQCAALITSVTFLAYPQTFIYSDVAYIDIASGTLFLAAGAAVIGSIERFDKYGPYVAVIFGSMIGTKASLAPEILLGATLIYVLAKRQNATRKIVVTSFCLILIFSSPWFIRNLVYSGDPFTPILNLTFHRVDPFWNAADVAGANSSERSGTNLLALPIAAYLGKVGDGVSLSFCFLYIPILYVARLLWKKFRNSDFASAAFATMVSFAILNELLVTDHVLRYTLHFYALFLVLLTLLTWRAFIFLVARLPRARSSAGQLAAIACISCFAIPSIGAPSELSLLHDQSSRVETALDSPEAYVDSMPGVAAADRLSNLILAAGSNARVLTINGENLAYFFRRRRVVSIGDWFGPGRLSDLWAAINAGTVTEYLHRFDIGAVMFAPKTVSLTSQEKSLLFGDLRKAGFQDVTIPKDAVAEFARHDILDDARAKGLTLAPTDAADVSAPATLSPIVSTIPTTKNAAKSARDPSELQLRMTANKLADGVVFESDPSVVSIRPGYHLPAVMVKWTVPGAITVEIHTGRPDGPLFTIKGSSGSEETGYWIGSGSTFYLEDATAGRPRKIAGILTAVPCSADCNK